MKQSISFFLTLSLGVSLAQAQQLEDAVRIFDEANLRIESGAYQEAVDLYLSALETGYVSGALYHNLASAYYRMDELGEAVRFYERAHRLLGDDPQLTHNIQIVESRIQSPFSDLPKPFYRIWWDQLFKQYSALPFLSAGIGLYLIACFLIGQLLWTKMQNDWHRRIRAASLSLGVLLLLIAVFISYEQNSIRGASILEPAILTTETEPVQVPEGIKVTLIDETPMGTRVRLPNGTQGYLDENVLGDF